MTFTMQREKLQKFATNDCGNLLFVANYVFSTHPSGVRTHNETNYDADLQEVQEQ